MGKYGIVAILLVAIARITTRRNRALSVAYFALLIPSVALTFMAFDLDGARQEASFNLSGPLALAVAVSLFLERSTASIELRIMSIVALVGPAVGVGVLSYLSTASHDALVFVNASNVDTGGGFGANQVSAILGLAALFLILLSLDRQLPWRLRIPVLTLATVLATSDCVDIRTRRTRPRIRRNGRSAVLLAQGKQARAKATVVLVSAFRLLRTQQVQIIQAQARRLYRRKALCSLCEYQVIRACGPHRIGAHDISRESHPRHRSGCWCAGTRRARPFPGLVTHGIHTHAGRAWDSRNRAPLLDRPWIPSHPRRGDQPRARPRPRL